MEGSVEEAAFLYESVKKTPEYKAYDAAWATKKEAMNILYETPEWKAYEKAVIAKNDLLYMVKKDEKGEPQPVWNPSMESVHQSHREPGQEISDEGKHEGTPPERF